MSNYAAGDSSGKAHRSGARAGIRTGCACSLGDLAWDNFTVRLLDWEDCTPTGPCSLTPGAAEVQRTLLWSPPKAYYVLPFIESFIEAGSGRQGCRFGLFNQSGEGCGNEIGAPGCSTQGECIASLCEYGPDMIVLEVVRQPGAAVEFDMYHFSFGVALPVFGSGVIFRSEAEFAFHTALRPNSCNTAITCGCDYTIPQPALAATFSLSRGSLLSNPTVFSASMPPPGLGFCGSGGVNNGAVPPRLRRPAIMVQSGFETNLVITQGP